MRSIPDIASCSDGDLSGYRRGIHRKRLLLERESRQCPKQESKSGRR
jgi:hypothetical protein